MQKISKYSAIALTSAILMAGCSDNKPTLHVYSWSDYISPELVAKFEEENDCHVDTSDTFDSNEAMYAKLKAGSTGYDIVVPTSYQVDLMVKEGMLAELAKTNIPNAVENFCCDFEDFVYDKGSFKYAVPYSLSYSGFMYDKTLIPNDADVNTWKILENPALHGRFSLLSDIREIIGAGLMYNGYSVNSTDQSEVDEAVKTIIKWKHNARKFDCESYKTEVASGSSWLGHGYSGDAMQVILGDGTEGSERPNIGFAYPKEGFTASCDEMVILKTSNNKALAEKFINFLFENDNAKANMEYIVALTPQKKALEKLDANFKKLILPEKDVMKKAQMIKSFTDRPEVFEMYNKAYDEIMSTKN